MLKNPVGSPQTSKSFLPNSAFGVSWELTRLLFSCCWNTPSIDESHRAAQFLPQNKCRNLKSQCLGQQPTSAAGDGEYYYFECAIIIYSSHCPTTFLTCSTWFPAACADGVTHTGPELNQEQALHCFIYQPLLTAELAIWVSALLGLQGRTTQITAGTKLLPPSWNISVLTGLVREVAGPVPSTKVPEGARTPGRLHQDAADPGRCSLQVVQGRGILTLVTQSLSQWKQFSSGYETRRKEGKMFPSGFEGRG